MTGRPLRIGLAPAVAGVAVLAALALPPAALAEWLRGPGDPAIPQLTTGLWVLKALILINVAAAVALARVLPRREAAPMRIGASALPVALLLIVGLLVRLPGLDGGLWYDEIETLVRYVRLPWGTLLTSFDSTNQHLLFSVGARAVQSVVGESAAALRLPAVLFGVASLWATVAFGRRWMPVREAWWSAIILTVSYHHIWFSQNARGYTGLLLGTVMGSAIFLDLLRSKSPSRLLVWGYAFVMALTLLTHVTALVAVAAHGICWLLAVRRLTPGAVRWAPLAALVLAGSVALMLYAPILPQVVEALAVSGTSSAGIEWQNPMWFFREAASGLRRGMPAGTLIAPIAGLIVLYGAAQVWRLHRDAAMIMLLPLVLMAILLLVTGHNLWPRFFFFGAAFIVQFAVHGGFGLLRRLIPRLATRIGDGALALVVVGSLFLLPRAWAPKQDYEAAAEWVAGNAGSGDTIVMADMMRLPMIEWLGNSWPLINDLPSLQALERDGAPTWVLYTFPIRLSVTAPDLWAYLQREYRVAHVVPATIGGGEIVVLSRRASQRTSTSELPAPNQ